MEQPQPPAAAAAASSRSGADCILVQYSSRNQYTTTPSINHMTTGLSVEIQQDEDNDDIPFVVSIDRSIEQSSNRC
jgi:hypothetical protein